MADAILIHKRFKNVIGTGILTLYWHYKQQNVYLVRNEQVVFDPGVPTWGALQY